MVAVPWSVYSPSIDLNTYTVTVERERIFNAPVFDYARIEEYSRPDYINNVYSYYGVSHGRGSWGGSFRRHFNDHNRRSHDNEGRRQATGATTGANSNETGVARRRSAESE